MKEIWMCGFQGTRRLLAQADPIKPKGRLSEEPEIIEKRVDCAEVPPRMKLRLQIDEAEAKKDEGCTNPKKFR